MAQLDGAPLGRNTGVRPRNSGIGRVRLVVNLGNPQLSDDEIE